MHLYNLTGVRDKTYYNFQYYYPQSFKRKYGNNLRLKVPTLKKGKFVPKNRYNYTNLSITKYSIRLPTIIIYSDCTDNTAHNTSQNCHGTVTGSTGIPKELNINQNAIRIYT